MSRREILGDHDGTLGRVAVRDGKALCDLYLEDTQHPDLSGAVVNARVTRVFPAHNTALVSFGKDQTGYATGLKTPREGDYLVLQVKAEAHDGKQATLNGDLVLPGRFLMHVPQGKGLTCSRRLNQDKAAELRARLAPLLAEHQGGWIARAASYEASMACLTQEITYLSSLNAQIGAAQDMPHILLPAPTALQRAIIDHGTADIASISLAARDDADKLIPWLSRFAPDLLDRLDTKTRPDSNWIDSQTERLTSPAVPLQTRASLMIEPTAALTAIDVNGGEESNVLRTNLLAVTEIARHIRWRNLGGMIVIDFIRMTKAADRDKILRTLRAATADDPARVEIFGFTKLGLVEMTRTRRGRPLKDIWHGR